MHSVLVQTSRHGDCFAWVLNGHYLGLCVVVPVQILPLLQQVHESAEANRFFRVYWWIFALGGMACGPDGHILKGLYSCKRRAFAERKRVRNVYSPFPLVVRHALRSFFLGV